MSAVICLSPEVGWPGSLVTEHPREVSPLSRGGMSSEGSTPIRPITGRHSLPPSSSPRCLIGVPLQSAFPAGRTTGLLRSSDESRWLRSASSPVARTATAGEGEIPCTWPRTFWFKPDSIFGLLVLTAFISTSPGLAMPSTLAPDRLDAGSRRVPSREARPPGSGEVTLSQELRTAGLLRPHVLVGYRWSHTGLCPGRKTSHNRYIRSFVSHLPPNRDVRLSPHTARQVTILLRDGTRSHTDSQRGHGTGKQVKTLLERRPTAAGGGRHRRRPPGSRAACSAIPSASPRRALRGPPSVGPRRGRTGRIETRGRPTWRQRNSARGARLRRTAFWPSSTDGRRNTDDSFQSGA